MCRKPKGRRRPSYTIFTQAFPLLAQCAAKGFYAHLYVVGGRPTAGLESLSRERPPGLYMTGFYPGLLFYLIFLP